MEGVTALLSAHEAEGLIERLQVFELKDVGTPRWMRQHETIQRLNIQAHQNAMTQGDEYVMEALITHEKLPLLVRDLILTEVWKAKVAPLVRAELAKNDIKAYAIAYHEAVVCNLLECVLFHRTALGAAGDALVDLADYLYRKLVRLSPEAAEAAYAAEGAGRADAERSVEAAQEAQAAALEYGIGITCLGILRFLTDHTSVVPISVLSQLLDTHDAIAALVPMIERPPWLRRDPKTKKSMCFEDGRWQAVPPEERPRLRKPQAQVWLALNNLLCDEECRRKYKWDSHRKATVLRLKSHLNETLIDQLPVLMDVQRALEYLTVMEPPAPTARPALLLETLPEMREALLRADFGAAARAAREEAFNVSDAERRDEIRRLAETFNLLDTEGVLGEPKCGVCGKPAPKRCSRCKNEWYCTRECQVKAWPTHKPLCDVVALK